MKTPHCKKLAGLAALFASLSLGTTATFAQQSPATGDLPQPLTLTNQQDHDLMMKLLGVESVRPGASGTNGLPNSANYDETKAVAASPIPDVLTLNNGQKVTTPAQWWNQRRPEIVEIFDREFYGRAPELAKTIKVTWTVTSTTQGNTGGIPTVTRQLNGHVDNSFYPLIDVNIQASVTTPANATGKVPVIVVLSGGGGGAPRGAAAAGPAGARGARGAAAPTLAGQALPTLDQLQTALTLTEAQIAAIRPIIEASTKAQQDLTGLQTTAANLRAALNDKIGAILTDAQKPMLAQALNPAPAGARGGGRGGPGAGVSWQQLALEKGWGYGSLNTGSVQADNGAGLTRGIIGLINKGQARKADDWGVLRTWAWGFSKLMDFFETDNLVDVKQVGVEGHSRWGKATAATMVYDSRVAIGYVSSSGEGGAKIWRHLMGETVENLTGSGEYHWMAGNFIKYGGPLTVNDLPGDAHELVALIAPRPVFVGGGNSGDAWQDPHGMFMAAAGASPVWELLGKKGLSNDALGINHLTMQSPMTGVQVPVIDGDIGFRLHEQGHTDAPNWPTFIEFASRYLHAPGH